ncbi:hypothetical protein [Actinomadura parmotrematis]|uniref:HIG1 domain-containing protein n=1 Tax=Actinomadura parmotrematis TaxID=2864039 RepID=A0ABS7FSE8_9ACTN|nr:hypothetical protein [Actinomadura parmotrematis]MBW8482438.1 hypothetical protein [Actinomadura parmotrematis]
MAVAFTLWFLGVLLAAGVTALVWKVLRDRGLREGWSKERTDRQMRSLRTMLVALISFPTVLMLIGLLLI